MRGFTLLELIILIAVMGILATIAIPHFMDYRQRIINMESYGARWKHPIANQKEQIRSKVGHERALPITHPQAGCSTFQEST